MNTEELKESVKYFKCSKDKMIREFANCKELKPLISCAESVIQVEGLPEKKVIEEPLESDWDYGYKDGYNQAINEYTLIIARDYVRKSSFPSVEDIENIMFECMKTYNESPTTVTAQAIHKLITGD